MKICNWFENWFDTNYYHLLYKHRDDLEAEKFIGKLLAFLKPEPNQLALDLACGKGRHSVLLNNNQLNVTGIDLSEKSIAYAKQFENKTLHFEVRDMRKNLGSAKFALIFNLFTSFGYFDNEEDDLLVLQNISNALSPNGFFVFDFLNASIIKNKNFAPESIEVEGIKFNSSKVIEHNFIHKKIQVNDHGKIHNYTEKVKLIEKAWFEKSFTQTGLKIQNIFGDYNLSPFNDQSERLIIVAKKN